jgi:hypothetical protein
MVLLIIPELIHGTRNKMQPIHLGVDAKKTNIMVQQSTLDGLYSLLLFLDGYSACGAKIPGHEALRLHHDTLTKTIAAERLHAAANQLYEQIKPLPVDCKHWPVSATAMDPWTNNVTMRCDECGKEFN